MTTPLTFLHNNKTPALNRRTLLRGAAALAATGATINAASAASERPLGETGRWLGSVVRGWLNFHAVPSNSNRICRFVDEVTCLWLDVLRRRSQRGRARWTWERMQRFARRYLPRPRIVHPYPDERFRARLKAGAV